MGIGEKAAVFLDRDGVILELVDYLHRAEDLRLMPGIGDALQALNRTNIPVIIITNQSGVARGILSEEKLAELHELMKSLLAEAGAHVDAIYYCPHHPEAGFAPYRRTCNCRKPAPGMILRAAAEFNIDLARSVFIGDTRADMTAAHNAGVGTTILVLTGHGTTEYAALELESVRPTNVVPGAPTAVHTLLESGNDA